MWILSFVWIKKNKKDGNTKKFPLLYLICLVLNYKLLNVGKFTPWASYLYNKGFDLWFDAIQERLDLFGCNKLEEEKVRKTMLNFHIHPFFLFFSLLLAQSPSLIGSSTLLSCFRKQNTKNFGFYVDSFIMGHGSWNYHGHCSCTWRGKSIWLQFFCSFLLSFIVRLAIWPSDQVTKIYEINMTLGLLFLEDFHFVF